MLHSKSVNENKLTKLVRRNIIKANIDFGLIENNDTVMVCVSGGKDSYAMLDALIHLSIYGEIKFKIIAMHVDQNEPKFKSGILFSFMENYLAEYGIEFKVVKQDIYGKVREIITDENATKCSLCSRLRRGVIYKTAKELGATKIALGHHADDSINTMFLNMFFNGSLKAMPPKLFSDDSENIVIRPMILCRETDLGAYARYKKFPILDCGTCTDQKDLERVNMKKMVADWDKAYPGRSDSIIRALQNVKPTHLVDKNLFDFMSKEERIER